MFRFLILGLLRDGVPRHGYALAKAYSERSGGGISTGNFYRELQRLVADGLVRTASNPPDADPRRAPYQITESGSRTFDAWLFEPGDLRDGLREDEISTRALFLSERDAAGVCTLFEQWQEQLWMRGKVLERARDAARAKGRDVLALLFSRRLKYTAADLEFLTEFRSAHERRATRLSTECQPAALLTPALPARTSREQPARRKPSRGPQARAQRP